MKAGVGAENIEARVKRYLEETPIPFGGTEGLEEKVSYGLRTHSWGVRAACPLSQLHGQVTTRFR